VSDSDIQVSPDSTGKLVDTSQVTTTAGTVQRQRVAIGDGATGGSLLTVSAGGAAKVDGSAVTQPVSGTFWQATQPVSGTFWQATQPVSGTVTANPPVSGSPVFGQGKVTTGGTAVQLASNALTQGVYVQALKQNTDQIYVGGSGVNTTHDGTGNGHELQPGQGVYLPVNNTNVL
jgi:hypothetical protein